MDMNDQEQQHAALAPVLNVVNALDAFEANPNDLLQHVPEQGPPIQDVLRVENLAQNQEAVAEGDNVDIALDDLHGGLQNLDAVNPAHVDQGADVDIALDALHGELQNLGVVNPANANQLRYNAQAYVPIRRPTLVYGDIVELHELVRLPTHPPSSVGGVLKLVSFMLDAQPEDYFIVPVYGRAVYCLLHQSQLPGPPFPFVPLPPRPDFFRPAFRALPPPERW